MSSRPILLDVGESLHVERARGTSGGLRDVLVSALSRPTGVPNNKAAHLSSTFFSGTKPLHDNHRKWETPAIQDPGPAT